MTTSRTKEQRGSFIKNLSISKKLIFGFGIVLILMVLSAVLSLYSINNIGNQIDLYGQYTVPNAEHLRSMQVDMQGILHSLLEAITANDVQSSKFSLDTASGYGKSIVSELDAYKNNQRNTDRDANIENLKKVIAEAAGKRSEINELVLNRSESNLAKALNLFQDEYKPRIDQAMKILLNFSTAANDRATKQNADAQATSNLAWILLISCTAISALLTIIVIISIRKSILNPVNEIVNTYTEISKGNMKAEIKYESEDELGQMARLIQKTNKFQMTIIDDIAEKFSKISQGDLNLHVDLDYPGDFTALKQTIESTISTLNNTMQNINIAAEQVSTGASQVSSGAQALASGSTEQAGSIEELNAAIIKISEQALENSKNVNSASKYVDESSSGAKSGNHHMAQLTEAMEEINSSSNQIANITKVIEDIAFQTNILALNAAIEAARAGNAGKGFAVVADEVRALAAKSAEAAKQTGELIQSSVVSVSRGTQITEQTAQVLVELEMQSQRVMELMSKIEQSSSEQANAIEEVKEGLTQISAVVQTNAATAEENSATSEEMSAQATTLHEEVAKFKLNTNNAYI